MVVDIEKLKADIVDAGGERMSFDKAVDICKKHYIGADVITYQWPFGTYTARGIIMTNGLRFGISAMEMTSDICGAFHV